MPKSLISAGAVSDLTPEMIDSGKIVVENWFLENGDVIYENGGTGDIHSLLTALWDSWKNARDY